MFVFGTLLDSWSKYIMAQVVNDLPVGSAELPKKVNELLMDTITNNPNYASLVRHSVVPDLKKTAYPRESFRM
jgi:hypothetical protein